MMPNNESEFEEIAQILDLAGFYNINNKLPEENKLLKEALLKSDQLNAPVYPNRFHILRALVSSYDRLGNPILAEQYALEALDIQEKNLGTNHPELVETLHQLADIYLSHQDISRASKLFLRSYQILEKCTSPDKLDLLDCLNGLAECYMYLGNFDYAEKCLIRAVDHLEKNYWVDEMDIWGVGATAGAIEKLMAEGNKPDRAKILYHRATTIFDKYFKT